MADLVGVQIHTINSDGRCQDIFTLLEKDRARDTTTPRQQIAYRMEVEQVLNQDENLYRLEWVRSRVGLAQVSSRRHGSLMYRPRRADPERQCHDHPASRQGGFDPR